MENANQIRFQLTQKLLSEFMENTAHYAMTGAQSDQRFAFAALKRLVAMNKKFADSGCDALNAAKKGEFDQVDEIFDNMETTLDMNFPHN